MRRVLSSCSLSLEAVKYGHTISAVGVEPCTGRLYFSGGGNWKLHFSGPPSKQWLRGWGFHIMDEAPVCNGPRAVGRSRDFTGFAPLQPLVSLVSPQKDPAFAPLPSPPLPPRAPLGSARPKRPDYPMRCSRSTSPHRTPPQGATARGERRTVKPAKPCGPYV